MSGFGASYAWDNSFCCEALLHQMGTASKRGDHVNVWSHGAVGLMQQEWDGKRRPGHLCARKNTRYAIVADARLDNRVELLTQFQEQDVVSDSDLIVASFLHWADDCVTHLHGDYSFVIWDSVRQRLFAARSPMGLRPFVYHLSDQRLLCASEAKQLFADEQISRQLNDTWIAHWLTTLEDHWSCTAFQEVRELQPGSTLIADERGIVIEQFWKPAPRTVLTQQNQQEYTEQFRTLLFDAVRCRLPQHQPLLIDISGGLDSSALACIACELGATVIGLNVFSYEHLENDDRALAALIADKYALPLEYISYEEMPTFNTIVGSHGWADAPTIPTLFLSDLYTSIGRLSVQFGIHAHMRGDFGDQLCSTTRYLRTLVDEHRYEQFIDEAEKWNQVHAIPMGEILDRNMSVRRPRIRSQAPPWLLPGVLEGAALRHVQDTKYYRKQCADPIGRRLFKMMLDHKQYVAMQSDGLVAQGIETLEPFTDMRLIEFMLSCPAQYQMRFGERKFLLREAMKGILPEEIRMRKSKGRYARAYFQGIARHHTILRELVMEMPIILTSYINPAPLAAALDRIAMGDAADQISLFSALSLVLWAHRLPWVTGNMLSNNTYVE